VDLVTADQSSRGWLFATCRAADLQAVNPQHRRGRPPRDPEPLNSECTAFCLGSDTAVAEGAKIVIGARREDGFRTRGARRAAGWLDQLAAVNRDEKISFALSTSLTLQAVKLASRLICVAFRFVFNVL
jgi:hypothetical protein